MRSKNSFVWQIFEILSVSGKCKYLLIGMQIARCLKLSMANTSATKDRDQTGPEVSLKLREGRPQRRLDLLCRTIESEAVILNGEAGILHRLNPTASFIWECCDGTSSVDDIVARLADAYDVDLRTCQKDVSEVVLKLESLNLLTINNAASGGGIEF